MWKYFFKHFFILRVYLVITLKNNFNKKGLKKGEVWQNLLENTLENYKKGHL